MGDPRNIKPWKEVKQQIPVPLIFYATLDGLPVRPIWRTYFSYCNMVLAMTEWATYEFLKADIPVNGYIHHGVNYHYWDTNDEEKSRLRRKYRIDEDTILFISRDVNQHRKRYDVLLKCWRDFKPESKNAKLLLWTDWNCRFGFNIEQRIAQYKVPRHTIISPEDLTGFPKFWECAVTVEEELEIAKLADVYCSASCFPKDTYIKTGFGGVQPIQNIKRNDILMSDRELNMVEEVYTFDYQGDLIGKNGFTRLQNINSWLFRGITLDEIFVEKAVCTKVSINRFTIVLRKKLRMVNLKL
jgi:glycosyltransferase involved in cell wall biosynthesis